MGYWRRTEKFFRQAYTVNVIMMSLGFMLIGHHITGYLAGT